MQPIKPLKQGSFFIVPTQQQQEAIKQQAVKDALDKYEKAYGKEPHWKGSK
jgi:hypothetical protein